MSPLNFAEIEKQARKMRSEELQRLRRVFLARLQSLPTAASKSLRHLFSWNPQSGNIRTVE